MKRLLTALIVLALVLPAAAGARQQQQEDNYDYWRPQRDMIQALTCPARRCFREQGTSLPGFVAGSNRQLPELHARLFRPASQVLKSFCTAIVSPAT